jgi:hypothetical protein
LQPDAGEAHLANAENLYRGHRDYDGALSELEIAHRTLPNDSRIFLLKGAIRRRQRWQEEALQSMERSRGDSARRRVAPCVRHATVLE